jgi:hypothetical protein
MTARTTENEERQEFVDAYAESPKKRDTAALHALQLMRGVKEKNEELSCEEEIGKVQRSSPDCCDGHQSRSEKVRPALMFRQFSFS